MRGVPCPNCLRQKQLRRVRGDDLGTTERASRYTLVETTITERQVLWAQLAQAGRRVAEVSESLEVQRHVVASLQRNGTVDFPIIYARNHVVEELDRKRQALLSERSHILRKLGSLTEPLKPTG
jgi:hypothetical protein